MPKTKKVRDENKHTFAEKFRDAGLDLVIDYHEPENIIRELTVLVGVDHVRVEKLETSDYMIGKVGFERKKDDITNLRDVIAKCTEMQSQFPISILIVEYNFDEVIQMAAARNYHRNTIIGMVASLVARGVIPIFAGKKRNLVDLMLAIGTKCNDGKDRTYIDPLRPMASSSDFQRRALNSLGLGTKASIKLLEHYGSMAKALNGLYVHLVLDDETKHVCNLNGIDAKVEKAVTYLEDKYERESI